MARLGRPDASNGFLGDSTYNFRQCIHSLQGLVPEPPALSLLSRIETLIETVAEGGFRRLFPPRLQPVEVARALARAMGDQKAVGTFSLDVPNRYVAHLNPTDFERFAPVRGAIERDLAAYLDRRADEEGYRPLGRIRVELASDARVPRSFVRPEAFFEEMEPYAAAALQHTRRLDPVLPLGSEHTLVLEGEDGQRMRIGATPIRIGRAADNDLVVRDLRVSRHHAAIELDGDAWTIRDLESSNGTYLEGEPIQEARVDAGAELSLGGYRVSLRAG